MAITQKQMEEIKKALDESVRPIFYFDDDSDGVCSFLLLYRYKGEGKGIILKTPAEVDERFASKADEYDADLAIVLDKPMISQEYIDKIKCKLIWLDHHPPVKRHKVHYYNPRTNDDTDSRPTSYWAYQIVKETRKQDLWIAVAGITGDWTYNELSEEFSKENPELLPPDFNTPDKVLYETPIGKLANIINLNLKGSTTDSMTSVKILTRLKDPNEILFQTTSQGKYIYKKYERMNKEYQSILDEVKVTGDKILYFEYTEQNMSMTGELSNELIYKHPEKIIIVARKKSGEMKGSMRASPSSGYILPKMIEKALEGVDGYGGGHDSASGFCIKEKDFEKFMEQFRKQI